MIVTCTICFFCCNYIGRAIIKLWECTKYVRTFRVLYFFRISGNSVLSVGNMIRTGRKWWPFLVIKGLERVTLSLMCWRLLVIGCKECLAFLSFWSMSMATLLITLYSPATDKFFDCLIMQNVNVAAFGNFVSLLMKRDTSECQLYIHWWNTDNVDS